jgi:hypothetical protein
MSTASTHSQVRRLLTLAVCFSALTSHSAPRQLLNATNTVWRFLPAVTNPGFATPWAAQEFDDSLWSNGTGLFGHDTTSVYPYPFRTFIASPVDQGPVTTYFRTHFNWTGSPSSVLLTATNYIDDGAVFYLNGTEIYRYNMPDGIPAYDTLTPWYPEEPSIIVVELPSAGLVEGDNVMAVELHQFMGPSSDDVFGMWVYGSELVPPTLTEPSEPADRFVMQCRSTVLSVAATSEFPLRFQWYHEGTPLTGATSAVYAIARMAASDAGAYFCRVSNRVAAVDSRTSEVGLLPDEAPPTPIYAMTPLDRRTVTISFDEPLLGGSGEGGAENPSRYTLRCPDDPTLEIRLATNSPPALRNFTNVVLSLDTSTPLPPDIDFQVTIVGVADNCSTQAIAAPITVAIASQVLMVGIDTGTRWRYQDTGVDLGAAWRAPEYDDGAWPSGEALFDGNGTGARTTVRGQAVRTHLALTNSMFPLAAIPSYYFRTEFLFPGDPRLAKLWLRSFWDDGAVLYLNGQEAFRLRVGTNDGFQLYTGWSAPGGDADFEGPFSLPLTNVVAGANIMGVYLKQFSAAIRDITMGLELIAEVPHLPPRVIIVRAPNEAFEIRWFGPGVLQASPDPSGGEWTDVSGTSPYSVDPLSTARFYRVRE